MVEDPALRLGATGTGAGVHTLVVRAGLAPKTVRVEDTLRSAALVRVSKESRETLACTAAFFCFAGCTGSTGVRGASIRLRGNWSLPV